MQVGLHHCEAGVDGWVAESVCEEGEVGEAWVWVVWVAGFDVAGTSDCIEHRLQLRDDQSVSVCVCERERESGSRVSMCKWLLQ